MSQTVQKTPKVYKISYKECFESTQPAHLEISSRWGFFYA